MSAILVKMPPAMRKRGGAQRLADGEADEARPGQVGGHEEDDQSMISSSTLISTMPIDMPAWSGIA